MKPMSKATAGLMAEQGYTAIHKTTAIQDMDIVELHYTTKGVTRTYFYQMFTWHPGDPDQHIRSNDSYILGGSVRYYPRNPGRRMQIYKPVPSFFHIRRNVTQIWRDSGDDYFTWVANIKHQEKLKWN